MPYMTEGIAKHVPEFEAWRWAYFLPGCLFIIITFLILTLGQVRGVAILNLNIQHLLPAHHIDLSHMPCYLIVPSTGVL
jgi:hypothetical protein